MMRPYLLIFGLGLRSVLGAEALDEPFGDQVLTIYGQRASTGSQSLENIDAIRASGGLKEALESAAGLDMQGLSGSKSFGKLSIRGADPKHTVVILNGQKLGQDFDLGSIPTENLESVEILKGPEALAYSPEALGGVLLITTRPSKGDHEKWTLGGALGNFSTRKIQVVSRDLKIGASSGSFSANSFSTEGYTANTDETALETELSARVDLGIHQPFEVKVSSLQRRGGIPLAQSLASNGAGEVDNDDREDRQSFNLGLNLPRQRGEWTYSLAEDFSGTTVRRRNPFGNDALAGVPEDNTDTTRRQGLRLPLTRRSGSSRLDLEADAAYEDLESGQAGSHRRGQGSLAVRSKFKLEENVQIELSGRADYVEGFPVDLEPVGSVTFDLAPGERLSFSAGGGRKVPEMDQLYRSSLAFDTTVAEPEFGAGEKGNSGLQPERSIKTQAVLDLQGDDISLNVAGFGDFLTDLIELQQDPADNYWTYANLGRARVSGAEASLTARLGRLRPFVNGSYSDARLENNVPIPGRLRQKLAYGAAFEPLEWLNLRVEHQYLERSGATSPYWMLNAGINAKVAGPSDIFVTASNLLDKVAEALPGLPMRGRYIEAGTRVEF